MVFVVVVKPVVELAEHGLGIADVSQVYVVALERLYERLLMEPQKAVSRIKRYRNPHRRLTFAPLFTQ